MKASTFKTFFLYQCHIVALFCQKNYHVWDQPSAEISAYNMKMVIEVLQILQVWAHLTVHITHASPSTAPITSTVHFGQYHHGNYSFSLQLHWTATSMTLSWSATVCPFLTKEMELILTVLAFASFMLQEASWCCLRLTFLPPTYISWASCCYPRLSLQYLLASWSVEKCNNWLFYNFKDPLVNMMVSGSHRQPIWYESAHTYFRLAPTVALPKCVGYVSSITVTQEDDSIMYLWFSIH